ncbi:MAG: hypothetical protein JNL43_01130 [Flavobacteriales bacterium]|nr:hypothetical protein [Flavobacteriales bacterium]
MRRSFLLSIVVPTCLHAQVISLQFNDGATINYLVPELRSTDMSADQLHAFLWDGTTYSWDLSTIKNMRFADTPTGDEATVVALEPLRAHPVPSNGVVQIGFNMRTAGPVTVDILDGIGGSVHTAQYAILGAGPQTVSWSGKDLSGNTVAAGVYLCRVKMGALQVSRKIVMEY